VSDLPGIIIGAAAGLAGTALVAGLGYRQWKNQRRVDQTKPFADARVGALRELWNKISEINLGLRLDERNAQTFAAQTRELNKLIIQNDAFLETDEIDWARRYVAALQEFASSLDEIGRQHPFVKWEFEITAEQIFIPDEYRYVFKLSQDIDECREQLRRRFRLVLSGQDLEVPSAGDLTTFLAPHFRED